MDGKTNRIRFLVSYDGTDYCGWQRQKHHKLTSVQAVLEEAISSLLNEPVSVSASGRTDTGVHAVGQVCHFDTNYPTEKLKNWDLAWALRHKLPPSIVVRKLEIAPPNFHATISAYKKTYRYYVYNSFRASPHWHRYSCWIRKELDLDHLRISTEYLMGKMDFKSLQSTGTTVTHTVREIYFARWWQQSPHLLIFEVTGSGFLKQMVRNIVGTQLMLEKKGFSPHMMKDILESKDRTQAGAPAPAAGLFLWKVYYPKLLKASD